MRKLSALALAYVLCLASQAAPKPAPKPGATAISILLPITDGKIDTPFTASGTYTHPQTPEIVVTLYGKDLLGNDVVEDCVFATAENGFWSANLNGVPGPNHWIKAEVSGTQAFDTVVNLTLRLRPPCSCP